jgi:hypothetical protein
MDNQTNKRKMINVRGAINKEFEGFGAGYMYLMPNWRLTQKVSLSCMDV